MTNELSIVFNMCFLYAKNDHRQNEKGFALIIVIVAMLLASFLASQLILQVRTNLKIADNVKKRTATRYTSEAGINLGLFRLMDRPLDFYNEEYKIFNLGYIYETEISGRTVSYYAVNETGKIDLNNAPRKLLELYFEYQGLDPDQTATLIDSILDWRDTDDLNRLNGAEQEYYQGLEDPYIPRNGNIRDPGEFFMIKGSEPLSGKIVSDEVFTIHNKQKKINFNSLTPSMLEFITGGDQETIDAYKESQETYGKLSAVQAKLILGDERFSLLSPYLIYTNGQNRNYFIVGLSKSSYSLSPTDEKIEKKHGPGTKISVIIVLDKYGYKYLSWKESLI